MLIEKAMAIEWDKVNLKDLFGFKGASTELTDLCCDQNSVVIKVTGLAIDLLGWIAFIMLIYASITYLISYGDESKAETAKKTILWSIVGVAVVVFSRWIIHLIYNLLK